MRRQSSGDPFSKASATGTSPTQPTWVRQVFAKHCFARSRTTPICDWRPGPLAGIHSGFENGSPLLCRQYWQKRSSFYHRGMESYVGSALAALLPGVVCETRREPIHGGSSARSLSRKVSQTTPGISALAIGKYASAHRWVGRNIKRESFIRAYSELSLPFPFALSLRAACRLSRYSSVTSPVMYLPSKTAQSNSLISVLPSAEETISSSRS